MEHLSHYGVRLVEERKKERRSILIFGCFRFVALKMLLHVAITTVHWGKPFKLLGVLLDAIAFALWWWYHHENAIIHWLEQPSCFQAIPTYGIATASPYYRLGSCQNFYNDRQEIWYSDSDVCVSASVHVCICVCCFYMYVWEPAHACISQRRDSLRVALYLLCGNPNKDKILSI